MNLKPSKHSVSLQGKPKKRKKKSTVAIYKTYQKQI